MRFRQRRLDWRLAGRIAMATVLLLFSLGHFASPTGLVASLPDFLPLTPFVWITAGLIELTLAATLVIKRTSYIAAMVLIALLVISVPSTMKTVIQSVNFQRMQQSGPEIEEVYLRLPIQFIYMFWTYYFAIHRQKAPWSGRNKESFF